MEAASDLGGTEGDKKLLSRREPKHQLSLIHYSTSVGKIIKGDTMIL